MFNLKKKAKQVAQEIKRSFEPVRDPQVVVAEIHEAFDSATDKLLADAKAILENAKDTSRGERLQKLGLRCSAPAKESANDISQKKYNKELADFIEYYSIHYPQNKFITEGVVSNICKKYGLVFGNAHWYKGDVPEKNISEMEAFQLRKEDWRSYHIEEGEYDGKKYRGYYKTDEYDRPLYVDLLGKDVEEVVEKTPFKICAPISDFDEYYIKHFTRVEDGYRLAANFPDPIVLQPVKGGYLIVTKWGLEASDPSVVNEINN